MSSAMNMDFIYMDRISIINTILLLAIITNINLMFLLKIQHNAQIDIDY
jgi:hypothetical protein